MPDAPKKGGDNWREYINDAKDQIELLRGDFQDVGDANEDNPEILNFLLKLNGRLDALTDAINGLWEIGVLEKAERLKKGIDNDE